MNKYLTGIIIGSVIGLVAVMVAFYSKPDLAGASIVDGQAYSATTTRNFADTNITNLAVIKNAAGTLGSVVITGVGSGKIVLYDATSTKTNASWATTTLAVIPASAPAGTYTYDVAFTKGLLIETSGVLATSTITYR